MKKYNKYSIYIVSVLSLLMTHTASFGWYIKIYNLTPYDVRVSANTSLGNHEKLILKGGYDTINATSLGLLTRLGAKVFDLPGGGFSDASSYKSSGQSTYDTFYIIGPIGGLSTHKYMVGRIVQ